ncbi:killer toxin [Mariannaea sp. PMI_226]|nr:killer toxin [Mariannaea sp. PMI_226]
MKSIGLSSVLAVAGIATSGVLGLGINCQGNYECHDAGGSVGDLISYVLPIDPNRWYNNGEHIACVENHLGTGICAFLQGTGGAPGSSILPLLQALQDHGCYKCGSVPLYFPQGDNDPNTHGILTINYVGSPNCNGLC